jgi:hypothetical protein
MRRKIAREAPRGAQFPCIPPSIVRPIDRSKPEVATTGGRRRRGQRAFVGRAMCRTLSAEMTAVAR